MTDQERFEALYGAHAGAVLGYALRRTSPANADDVVAEVFLVAWRRLQDVPDDARIWLLAVARRVLANQRRGQTRQLAVRDRLLSEDPLSYASIAVADSGDEWVWHALAKLKDDDREALLLLGWEGLSHSEAAQLLGIRARTFSVRLHRARKRFAQALASTDAPSSVGSDSSTPVEVL